MYTHILRILQHSSTLLIISGIISKGLGLFRDRLFIQYLPSQNIIDTVFASFRIPDFIYSIIVLGSFTILLIPMIIELKDDEKDVFVSRCMFFTACIYGVLIFIAILLTPYFVPLLMPNIDPIVLQDAVFLSRLLFVGTFFLALSQVLSSFLQASKRFFTVALTPVLYTFIICLTLLFYGYNTTLQHIGYGFVASSLLYFIVLLYDYTRTNTLYIAFYRPSKNASKVIKEYFKRMLSGVFFQVNYMVDTAIAARLTVGSLTATTLGLSLGSLLLTIIGTPFARSLYPYLSENRDNYIVQYTFLLRYTYIILAITIPITIIFMLFYKPFILLLYPDLDVSTLHLTQQMFYYTVLSLPVLCLTPLWSRWFLANNDSTTPLYINIVSLTIGTALALILCFTSLNGTAVGIAIATSIVNYMLFIAQFIIGYYKYIHSSRAVF